MIIKEMSWRNSAHTLRSDVAGGQIWGLDLWHFWNYQFAI